MTPPDPHATGSAAGRPLFIPERAYATAPDEGDGPSTPGHPASRLAAAALLVAAAAIHNAAIQWLPDTERFLGYGALMAAYGAGAWLLARRWRRADPPAAAASLFLALDLLALAATVYVTGAARSWLFWAFLLLVVDRLTAGWRRAAVAAALGPGAYLAVVAVAAGVEGQTLDPGTEAGKLGVLVLAGGWVTLVAWRAERDRRRVAERLGEASAMAADLVEDYAHLESSAGEERRARSAFLARLAEEVRAPLLRLLRSVRAVEGADGAGAGHAELRDMGVSARHVLDIVNEVMDLAHVESGTLTRELGPVAVGRALDDVLTQAIGAAERRRIRMPVRAPVSDEVRVVGNDRKLRQVFANLISNAIKYNRVGGRIDVECEVGDGRLTVRVRDTGPGLSPDQLEAAFAPFDRLGAERRGIGGTGLGLHLARALVEAMGGDLGVETAPGSGSAFWFRLRLADPPAPAGSGAEPRAADPGAPDRHAADPLAADPLAADPLADPGVADTNGDEAWASWEGWAADVDARPGVPALVLHIDASPENAGRVGRALAGRPEAELLWTPLGRQGLEAAAARAPALVLLHVQLLDMPVEEVFHRLRRTLGLGGPPIVAVAPHGAAPPELDRLLEGGARGPLTTPIQDREVLQLLTAALAER